MLRFYELFLLGDRVTKLPSQPPMRALRLAQRWLRDLSYQGMCDYLEGLRVYKFSTLIELGLLEAEVSKMDKDPQIRPYADPYYWAAFTFSGVMEGMNHGR